MSILRIRDASGRFVAIPSIKGDKGDKGDAGSVTAVSGVAPDGSGNVTLTAADVKALAADGTAADSSLLGGKAPEYYIQPRNLLDNSDFMNPVNQRGQTSYSTTGYAIDRWLIAGGSGSIAVDADGVTFSGSGATCYPQQRVQTTAAMVGRRYTAAVCLKDGTVHVFGDGILSTRTPAVNTPIGQTKTLQSGVMLALYIRTDGCMMLQPHIPDGAELGLKWAALYEGSYTEDTLPPYVPKGYEAELMACRRYLVPVKTTCLAGYTYINAAQAQFFVPLTVPLRTAGTGILPTIDVVEYGTLRAMGSMVAPVGISTAEGWVTDAGIVLMLELENTDIGANQAATWMGMKLMISADL